MDCSSLCSLFKILRQDGIGLRQNFSILLSKYYFSESTTQCISGVESFCKALRIRMDNIERIEFLIDLISLVKTEKMQLHDRLDKLEQLESELYIEVNKCRTRNTIRASSDS